MNKIAFILLLGSALLSCKKNRGTNDCKDKVCTLQFASIPIRFVDNKGMLTEVKDFKVINQRTGQRIYATSTPSINMIRGNYLVADDGNIQSFSEKGDDLKISGTFVETNQTKSVIVKVSGGECACHVERVSGPDQVTFD